MPHATDRRITIRFKPEEYARLEAKAGSRPVSQYIRSAVFEGGAAKRRGANRRVLPDAALAAKVLALLGPHPRLSGFKEAAARIEDGIEPAAEETKVLLSEIRDWLAKLHSLLMAALNVGER